MASAIDEALELLEDTGPEFGGFLSNHGPMAAEALVTLRRADALVPWVEGYKHKLEEHPKSLDPIAIDEWHQFLGDFSRIGDWIAFFDQRLSEASWQNVLNQWVLHLAPGMAAGGTHGLIRTGHAVRSLADTMTPLRLHELAEGLGYWAARYQLLPGDPSSPGAWLPSQAIHRVAILPFACRASFGSITAGLHPLDGFPPFNAVINLVDTSGDVSHVLSNLTETFARVFLANASDFGRAITFIHAVTGPGALRLLAPHLAPETTQTALRYTWQMAAALYTAFGQACGLDSFEAIDESADDMIDRAVATGDEHAIKFTEACLREHALNPKPVYLAAAHHASETLRPR